MASPIKLQARVTNKGEFDVAVGFGQGSMGRGRERNPYLEARAMRIVASKLIDRADAIDGHERGVTAK